jgi:hypothetical protein
LIVGYDVVGHSPALEISLERYCDTHGMLSSGRHLAGHYQVAEVETAASLAGMLGA